MTHLRTCPLGLLALLSFVVLAVVSSGTLAADGFPRQDRSRDPSQKTKILNGMGMFPFPAREEWTKTALEADCVRAEALAEDDVNRDFSNLSDLGWLAPIAKENKIVFVGEWPLFETCQRLSHRILFALNGLDRFPFLLIERPMSQSGYLDHYIWISDEKAAEEFWQAILEDVIADEGTRALLEHLRRWNAGHAERGIHVGAYDVEADALDVLRRIVVPYIRKIDSSFASNLENFRFRDLDGLMSGLSVRLKAARSKNVVGEFPFLTPSYIENVVESVRSTFYCDRFDYMYYRQKAIIRNLTDPRFFGPRFDEGKVMIYGSEGEAPTHFPYPDDENFYRAGSYLSYDFPATRGRAYSIVLKGLALRMGPMADVDPDKLISDGGNFPYFVRAYQTAARRNLVTPQEYIRYGLRFDDWDLFCLSLAEPHGFRPLLLSSVKWDVITARAKGVSGSLYGVVRAAKKYQEMYDLTILVPCSPITAYRPKTRSSSSS